MGTHAGNPTRAAPEVMDGKFFFIFTSLVVFRIPSLDIFFSYMASWIKSLLVQTSSVR